MIIVPTNLNLSQHIKDYVPNYKFKYLWVIHTILEHSQYDNAFEGYVNLHSKMLEKYLGHRYVTPILKTLHKSEIIEINQTYSSGNFSKSYRLAEPYRSAVPIVLDEKFPDNYRKKKSKELALTTDKHKDMYHNLLNVEIDTDAALKFIDTLTVNSEGKPLTDIGRFWYKVAVHKIANKDIQITEDRTGRVHHNLTNLPGVLRQFLTYKGDKLHSTDVSNSQVVLFLPLLESYAAEQDISDSRDISLFKELCEKGKFYEYVMQDLGVPLENRKVFKASFFAKIFYSTGTVDYPETKRFRSIFPSVYAAIKHYKRNHHADLPITMQRTEASLIVRLKVNCFYFTCHDAIISLKDDVPYIQGLMANSFQSHNINPTLKTGIWS